MTLIGALPFTLSGSIPFYPDALFETASGFTTTGSTILTAFDAMPRSDMFWRCFSHWIGGMGVLVFLMAVLPMSGDYSMHIMRAEVPGPVVGKLVPRARQTAKVLYLIYLALTLLEMLFLLFGGMSFYDALLHAFSTAGTGGFSPNAASIGGYDSLYLEIVIAVFMFLFGVNFNLYYLILIRRASSALRSEELHRYVLIIFVSALAISVGITGLYGNYFTALRHAFFNTLSVISTTGFATVDFTLWPEYCKWILILLMFCGACAGSTAGGLKLSRVMILLRAEAVSLRQMLRPRNVSRVQLDGKRVDDGIVKAAALFFTLYLLLLLLFSMLISFDGFGLSTSFTAVLSCLSNVGPGMTTLIGPMGNFSCFSVRSKVLLTLAMLLGRLEIYPILILFFPRTWKQA